MPSFRTHYDTLKVAHDAPSEVIQAAYRSLARKYHPDVTKGSADGEAMMKSINASYEVLSDPVRRAKHDRWIAAQRAGEPEAATGRVGGRGLSVESLLVAVGYGLTMLFLLRLPGYPRVAGVLMLLGGLVMLQRWLK